MMLLASARKVQETRFQGPSLWPRGLREADEHFAAPGGGELMGRLLVNIPVSDLQLDEIWSYIAVKEGQQSARTKGQKHGRCVHVRGD
jgi:hypothetical protein